MTDGSQAAIERRLRLLEDIEAVRNVVNRFAFAVDAADIDSLEAIFHPEILIVSRRRASGIAESLAYYREFFSSDWSNTRHFITNTVIKVVGDTASADSAYFQTATVGNRSVVGWGKYIDELQRVGQNWLLIAKTNRVEAMTDIQEGWAGGAVRGMLDGDSPVHAP